MKQRKLLTGFVLIYALVIWGSGLAGLPYANVASIAYNFIVGIQVLMTIASIGYATNVKRLRAVIDKNTVGDCYAIATGKEPWRFPMYITFIQTSVVALLVTVDWYWSAGIYTAMVLSYKVLQEMLIKLARDKVALEG